MVHVQKISKKDKEHDRNYGSLSNGKQKINKTNKTHTNVRNNVKCVPISKLVRAFIMEELNDTFI
jgi:L-rhamnose isomerase